jgi:hypothetical protein
MDTRQVTLDGLKQGAQKHIAEQQQKGLSFLTCLLEAHREVLEFEVGVIEDVLKLIKTAALPRPASGS